MSAVIWPGSHGPRIPSGKMPEEWEDVLIASEEPLQAFRGWYARAFDSSHYLLPLYSDYPPWPHYKRMEALCPHLLRQTEHEDPRLRSMVTPGQFASSKQSRTVFQVYINHTRHTDHPPDEIAPYPGCSCGTYFNKRFEDVTLAPTAAFAQSISAHADLATGTQVNVVGSCRIWGRVIECEKGYRAQYAYPERLFILLPRDGVKPEHEERQREMELLWQTVLKQCYGVPVNFCQRDDLEAIGRALAD